MKGWLRHVGAGALAVSIIIAWSTAFAMLVSCGSGNKREQTIRAAVITTNTARDAFMRWDEDRQQQIVKDAATRDEYERKVAAHRAKRDQLRLVFYGVYERLAKASITKTERELDDAIKVVQQVSDAMKDLTPTTDGPDPAQLPPPPNLKPEPCATGSPDPCPSLPPLVPADAGVSP